MIPMQKSLQKKRLDLGGGDFLGLIDFYYP